ncbi:hypothetical protein GCM10027563_01470 [Parasphingorhabdus pacifica]
MNSEQVLLLLFMGAVAVLPWVVIAVESRVVRDWLTRRRVRRTTRETRNQIASVGLSELPNRGECVCMNSAGGYR